MNQREDTLIYGNNGKSNLLKTVKSILSIDAAEMINEPLNVNQKMNDMTVIYEEMQKKYFGSDTNDRNNTISLDTVD